MARQRRHSVEDQAYELQPVDPRDGAEGMIAWTEEYVYVPIYPLGSFVPEWTRVGDLPKDKFDGVRSYWSLWVEQKEILREALRMKDGRFIYRLLVFCWMRGEGKSLIVCLILLWKFFNWDQQKIMLGANSRDQVKFVHFDIMRDIILNSPNLLGKIGGKKNLQEKEIRYKDSKGNIRCLIRSISSFSGIVSNITGYSFSEIFDMKNPKFFVQLDGSIRNIPNAFGLIDSTVSAKTHVLYQLYSRALKRETKGIFFSYRYSKEGNTLDYWNPNMTEDQLNDYKMKFPFGEYERYFLNLWSAGQDKVFSDAMVEEIGYLGCDGHILNHPEMMELLNKKQQYIEVMKDTRGKGLHTSSEDYAHRVVEIDERFKKVNEVYVLSDGFGAPRMASMAELEKLGEMFDTHWAVSAGIDFGDPYAVRGQARTILTIVAKGLPNSRTNPYLGLETAPKYIYFILHVVRVDDHSMDAVKKEIDEVHAEYEGIDTFCSERYGAWDVAGWCEDRHIMFEPVFPIYDRQREAFKEVLIAIKEGRLKCPPTRVHGSKAEDITREEFIAFNHDAEKRWFGSVEKMEKYGIQDDFIFSLGWNLYGARNMSVDDFRYRKTISSFGTLYPNKDLLGHYA